MTQLGQDLLRRDGKFLSDYSKELNINVLVRDNEPRLIITMSYSVVINSLFSCRVRNSRSYNSNTNKLIRRCVMES